MDRYGSAKRFLKAIGWSVLLTALALTSSRGDFVEASSVGGSGQIRYGISQVKGFDTCSAPTSSQMQTWWNSPYYDVGIYIGGVSRSCPQPNLTASWVTTVHSQGWGFYLIWAGPVAPCSGGSISLNTATAYDQGRLEADRADRAATDLGFTGKNIYYYDMENYNETDVACRNAVNSFINGWTYQTRNVWANKVGVYGNGCDASYWPFITNVPDDVWIADGSGDPDVWGLYCLPDGYWIYNQRLHQYSIDVWESYGGVFLQIDRDCANGLVVPHGHGNIYNPACTVE